MVVETKKFGRMEVDESSVITFPRGLMGLERFTRFVLVDIRENIHFKWLQSVDEAGLCFLAMDPFLLKGDYEFEIDDAVETELDVDSEEDVFVLSLVTYGKNGLSGATANLLAPLIVNHKKHLARQVLVSQDEEMLRVPLREN